MAIKTERGKKSLQDRKKLSKDHERLNRDINKNTRPLGMNGDILIEPIPFFNKASCEDVYSNGNSWIVLGRDRDAGLNSGYMGAASTAASSIDLVVGRGSSHKPFGEKSGSPPDDNIAVNPNFFTDAARIYVSQRADIDDYFGLAKIPIERSKKRSAIGIKADCVRIVGRNDIKIITGKGLGQGGVNGELNSAGGKIEGPGTISLIAGNYTEGHTVSKLPFYSKISKIIPDFAEDKIETLQPIPKGDNLIECIRELMQNLNMLSSLVLTNHNGIRELAGAVSLHFHEYGSPFGPTSPSGIAAAKMMPTYIAAFDNLLDNFSETYNYAKFHTDYLKENSPLYINSRHVFTT